MSDPFFAASINPEACSIDLHAYPNIQEALDHLEQELYYAQQEGESYVRIIHGIGSGRMAAAVQRALTENPLVHQWKQEDAGGSTIALF